MFPYNPLNLRSSYRLKVITDSLKQTTDRQTVNEVRVSVGCQESKYWGVKVVWVFNRDLGLLFKDLLS